MARKITIIDCFIRNEIIEEKLKMLLLNLKSRCEDVLLISNTPANKEILEICDFYIYDKRNQLFKSEYTGVEDVDFFNSGDGFMVHNIKPGLQRHGLSVLVNLFTAIEFVKNMGYTHFRRLECDDLFGEISMDKMISMEDECIQENKKGIFYFNESPEDLNVSFHYFFCDVRYFLRRVERIDNEFEYIEYLLKRHGNRDFIIVEKYVYENLKRYDNIDDLIKKDGKDEMLLDFPDTLWNTETSGSNISEKYGGCITEIYNKYLVDGTYTGKAVYSNNYSNENKYRKIRAVMSDGTEYNIEHHLPCKGAWSLNPVPDNISSIDVYENDVLLYSQTSEKIKSYIKWD